MPSSVAIACVRKSSAGADKILEPFDRCPFLSLDQAMTTIRGNSPMNADYHINLPVARFGIAAIILITGMAAANAQQFSWPEEPENLKVLPEDVKGAKLGSVMRGFASALGVRCEHCHVGEGPDLTKFDFPSDEKATKRKARVMLQMVHALNEEYLPKISEIEERTSPALEVTCMTCHRRQSRPVMLQDLLADSIKTDGIDAAEGKYRNLREEYYGGFSYDFSAGALTGLGEQLGREGDFESAIRFINIEIEMNGDSPAVYYTLGGVQASADLVEDAIDSFSKGLEMAPEDWKPFFQRELDQLRNKGE